MNSSRFQINDAVFPVTLEDFTTGKTYSVDGHFPSLSAVPFSFFVSIRPAENSRAANTNEARASERRQILENVFVQARKAAQIPYKKASFTFFTEKGTENASHFHGLIYFTPSVATSAKEVFADHFHSACLSLDLTDVDVAPIKSMTDSVLCTCYATTLEYQRFEKETFLPKAFIKNINRYHEVEWVAEDAYSNSFQFTFPNEFSRLNCEAGSVSSSMQIQTSSTQANLPSKTSITVRLGQEDKENLRNLALFENSTVSDVVRKAVWHHFDLCESLPPTNSQTHNFEMPLQVQKGPYGTF